mgnify:CR=1 FL=1
MEDHFYSFCGWFVPKIFESEIVTYIEVSKTEFFNMLDEFKIVAKRIDKVIQTEKIKDDNFIHVNYVLDDYLIGSAEFVLIDDEVGVSSYV